MLMYYSTKAMVQWSELAQTLSSSRAMQLMTRSTASTKILERETSMRGLVIQIQNMQRYFNWKMNRHIGIVLGKLFPWQ